MVSETGESEALPWASIKRLAGFILISYPILHPRPAQALLDRLMAHPEFLPDLPEAHVLSP